MNQSDMICREVARLQSENRRLKVGIVIALVVGTINWVLGFA